jgi:hypothetical protein
MIRALMIVAVLCGLASCGRGPKAETETAVRQAVERYLASRPNLNMAGMQLDVSRIQFRGQTAEAEVTFRAKNDSKAVMSIQYKLKRKGNGWEVEPGETGHGGVSPSAAPSTDLPAGHPPVGSSPAPDVPSGHPQVKNQ